MRLLPLVLLLLVACSPEADAPPEAAPTRSVAYDDPVAERVLADNLDRIQAYADSIEAVLRPVPLLTQAQANVFNRFRNADQLAAARRLGVAQPVSNVERLVEQGRLVRLEQSNALWFVRDLDYSEPYVTPDAYALLTEIGERFQARIADEFDLPPLRLEVTSVLRTAESQAALRRVNPNAARGESTHQFGTTLDVTYASFRAPLEPVVELDVAEAPWLEPHLRRVEALAAETGAARMSRELQAVLGHVLREMQNEGKVMVTMELRQPVYHFTVARRY